MTSSLFSLLWNRMSCPTTLHTLVNKKPCLLTFSDTTALISASVGMMVLSLVFQVWLIFSESSVIVEGQKWSLLFSHVFYFCLWIWVMKFRIPWKSNLFLFLDAKCHSWCECNVGECWSNASIYKFKVTPYRQDSSQITWLTFSAQAEMTTFSHTDKNRYCNWSKRGINNLGVLHPSIHQSFHGLRCKDGEHMDG